MFAFREQIIFWDQPVLRTAQETGFSFLKIISVKKLKPLTPANTTLCCSDQNSYCISFHEHSILVLSMRYSPFIGFYFFWPLMVYSYPLMLACSRDTGTSLTQKNWKERDHSTSVCAVIHCNRNYNVLAVTRIKNLHEKKKKK